MHPVGMDPHHLSRALGVRVESRMLEKPPDRRRHLSLKLGNVHEDQAISTVPEAQISEVPVPREERRLFQPVQHGQDVVVADALVSHVRPDLPDGQVALTQPPDFDLGEVLVYDQQAV
jgi:hypothetical protein